MANLVQFVDDRYLVALMGRLEHFDGVCLAFERPVLVLLHIVVGFGKSVAFDIVVAFVVAIADDDKRVEDWLAVAALHIVWHLYTLFVFSNNH